MEEANIIINAIVTAGGVAAAVTAIGVVGWKIKNWLSCQTDTLSKSLKEQHDCIIKVEKAVAIVETNSQNSKEKIDTLHTKIMKIQDFQTEGLTKIAKMETALDAHIHPEKYRSPSTL